MKIFRTLMALGAALAAPAAAQPAPGPVKVVAVPPLATPENRPTDAGETGVIGIQVAQLIAADLRASGAAFPVGPEGARVYTYTEAAAPLFANWQGTGASALVTGFVQQRSDGRLMIACYLHDLKTRRELTRKGFAVAPADWRGAAHRCADAFYEQMTGKPGYFSSRVAYVAETGPMRSRVKRIAVMALDGTDHRYLTQGEATVFTPRFSPDGRTLAYVSFTGGQPHVRLVDVASGQDRPLAEPAAIAFAPRFAPDGQSLVFTMASGGNSDLYRIAAGGGFPERLTSAPGTDTAGTFAPDGDRIAFESDRSGTQQLYVMNADGSGERRISFGAGAASSPAWSPDGEWIAFVRIAEGRLRIAMIRPDGSGERIVSDGWQDEAPEWGPGSQLILFQRTERGTGQVAAYQVPAGGGTVKRLPTPQGASEPALSGPGR